MTYPSNTQEEYLATTPLSKLGVQLGVYVPASANSCPRPHVAAAKPQLEGSRDTST